MVHSDTKLNENGVIAGKLHKLVYASAPATGYKDV